MKRLISISLIFFLVLQTFTSVSFLTVYRFNKSLITEVFCVNKDKPVLHCEGKCFIKQQLTKEKETHEQSSKGIEVLTFHLFMPQLITICLETFNPEHEVPIAFYQQYPLQSSCFPTFHPPMTFC